MMIGIVSLRCRACSVMAVICCLLPSTRKTRWWTWSGSRRSASSNARPITAGMSSVIDPLTHVPRASGPGCSARPAAGAAMSCGARTAG